MLLFRSHPGTNQQGKKKKNKKRLKKKLLQVKPAAQKEDPFTSHTTT
jgi:hypothetical protein